MQVTIPIAVICLIPWLFVAICFVLALKKSWRSPASWADDAPFIVFMIFAISVISFITGKFW
jgi:hypothetical protein